MPTISVIIPAYNGERTILETIKSVQAQTFTDFELLIVDDGSTDRTLDLLRSIQEPRLKIFTYENGGLTVNRNRGITLATGEFMAFIDQDDLWTPDKLELQLAALQQNPKAGVAYSWTSVMGEKGEWFLPCEQMLFEGNVYPELLAGYFPMNGSNLLVRREAVESVGQFDLAIAPCDDWEYALRLAVQWPFVLVPKIQNFYRQSATSVASNIEVVHKANLLILEKAFKSAPQEIQHLKNKCFANVYLFNAEQYLRRQEQANSVNKAGQNLWQAIKLYPQILKDKRTRGLVKWVIKKWFFSRITQRKLTVSTS
jgi:glycosyltransferase involved in cell wall biosynthesis